MLYTRVLPLLDSTDECYFYNVTFYSILLLHLFFSILLLIAQALGVQRVPLETLLKESDYVLLCCPLTSESKHLINANTLKLMKSNAVLVNIGRGGKSSHLYNTLLVDEEERV